MDNSDLTVVEKITVLYYGLRVAKEIFSSATEIAFFEGMITSRQKIQWEHFFEHELRLSGSHIFLSNPLQRLGRCN